MRSATALLVFAVFWIIRSAPATCKDDSAGKLEIAASEPESLRVEQVVADVIRHNDRVAAMRLMNEAAKAKARTAGAWDDPMLMVGVANLPTSFDFRMDPMTMTMIGLSQTIPYAGEKGLLRKAAEADALKAVAETHEAEIELATAAKLAYYDLVFNLRSAALIAGQVQIMEDLAATLRSTLAAGGANPEDVAAAQAALWRLQTQTLPAAHAVESAQYNLNRLRGLPVEASVPPPVSPIFPIIPASVKVWLEAARLSYPPLRKLAAQSRSYDFSARAVARMRWPMVTLSGNYGVRASSGMERRDNMIGFQATISLPLLSGRQQGSMARSMGLMRESADAEAVQLWRDVETKVRSLYLDATHLSGNLEAYRRRIIPAGEDAYQNAMVGYTNNRTTFSTLLTYALNIFADRMTANQIEYDLARTLAEVEAYTTDPAIWSEK